MNFNILYKTKIYISFYFRKFTELKETIYKYKKIRNYWESHYSTLSMNIWTGQIKYLELRKKEANLRNEISEIIEIIKFQQQELKNLIKERTIYFTKQWYETISFSKF